MKQDVYNLSKGIKPSKIPSKETLNHSTLLSMASGIEPSEDTQGAYLRAYEALGIDMVNRIPEQNHRSMLSSGESIRGIDDYDIAYLGFYDTYCRRRYPYREAEDFLSQREFGLCYSKLITPVPHRLNTETIARKSAILGDVGLYYYMYYTTLFMWGVEWLGWEVFMTAAAIEPDTYDRYFLEAAFKESLSDISVLCDIQDNPFVFIHDDLADAKGSVFRMDWYDKYIFPRYKKLFSMIHAKDKKVIFTADGNMEPFFDQLLACGVDGVMLESPATSFDRILDRFSDKIIIGGIETARLTLQTPREVAIHTDEVLNKTKGINGFALSSCGGLHGNIPIKNLEAYFDTRAKHGITREGWKIRK